ncbi:MAG: PorT family protein [Bacteroidales bacterium]|jgi:hypothetical protein|nr:PorT family protein [Bacteroidales bacterium]
MQVNKEHIDELFVRKIGDMEITPPENAWQRIDHDLSYRNRSVRRFWMAAASIALLSGSLATFVYLREAGNTGTEHRTAYAPANTPDAEEANGKNTQNRDMTGEVRQNHPAERTGTAPSGQTTETMQPATARISQQYAAQEESVRQLSPPDVQSAARQPDGNIQAATVSGNVPSEYPDETGIRHPATFGAQTPVYMDLSERMEKMRNVNMKRMELLAGRTVTKEKAATPPAVAASPAMPVYNPYFVDPEDIQPAKPANKWEIAGQFAPMYSYRTISDVPANMRRSDFDNAESALLAYSGGVKVSYKVIRRFSIQTGIFYTQMGQSVNQVAPTYNLYAAVTSNNSYSKNFIRTSSGNATVTSSLKAEVNDSYANYFSEDGKQGNAAANYGSLTTRSTQYRMVERLDYLEIPMLFRYKVIDRKLIFSLLGGMSTNILINNNVFIDDGNELIKEGSILMARPVNYNGTFGMGMSYQVTNSLLIGVEPLFKYFIQSYTTNNPIDSHPYSFGVFTGLVYQF